MVITFKDADLDVTAMHYSWDGFETTDRVLNINQIYDWQTNRWDGIAWKWRGDVIPISVYIEDALGNRSEIYEYNVNTIIID